MERLGHRKEMQKANPEFASKVWQGYQQLFGKDLRRCTRTWSWRAVLVEFTEQ